MTCWMRFFLGHSFSYTNSAQCSLRSQSFSLQSQLEPPLGAVNDPQRPAKFSMTAFPSKHDESDTTYFRPRTINVSPFLVFSQSEREMLS